MKRIHAPLLLTLSLICWPAAAADAPAQRIVAIGDVHGDVDGFKAVLTAAGLLGEDLRWSGGETVLVQTGDLTDRGPRVRQVLDLMMALEKEAPEQGGKVVALLGNHEILNLTGFLDTDATPLPVFREIWGDFVDENSERRRREAFKQWRIWQRKYSECGTSSRSAWMTARPLGYLEYFEALSPEGVYGRWLRSLPIAAEVGDTIFLHGGLSPELLEQGIASLNALNARGREELARFDEDRAQLIADGVIPQFANLGETFCALRYELAGFGRWVKGARALERDNLQAILDRLPGTGAGMLFDPEGPLWYRGLATWTSDQEEPLEKILTAFGGRRLVVGHTPHAGQIQERLDGRIFLIDTAMVYGPKAGGKGSALELEGDRAVAIYADGREVLVGEAPAPEVGGSAAHAAPGTEPAPACAGCGQPAAAGKRLAPWVGADGLPGHSQQPEPAADPAAPAAAGGRAAGQPAWLGADSRPLPFTTDAEILDFLKHATVVDREKVGSGVTQPVRLLLEKDGVRARAIFHDVDVTADRQRLAGGKMVMFFRDNYINNVAAYRLARLLWIDNVPPVVVRRIDGDEGSVQLWIEDAKTEADRRAGSIEPPGNWRLAWDDMWVFDNLVNNIDRNQGNILYDSAWRMLYIDHTRSFGRDKQLPDPDGIKRCSRRLWRRLQEVSEPRLRQELKPYLGTFEIAAVVGRRGKLLKHINGLINDRGEAAVLRSYDDPVEPSGVRIADPELPAALPVASQL